MAEIDKFAYLRCYVTDSAKACIAEFRATAANNKLAAVEVLQKRFGKKSVIQQAHINALLNISPAFNDWNAARPRKLYDAVECNHRGLFTSCGDQCRNLSEYCRVCNSDEHNSIRSLFLNQQRIIR